MQLNNKVYNILKWIVMICLPAINTLVFSLAAVWGWEDADTIIGTISAATVFLGALIGVSTVQYNRKKEGAGNE